jgi:hypothetical protein
MVVCPDLLSRYVSTYVNRAVLRYYGRSLKLICEKVSTLRVYRYKNK